MRCGLGECPRAAPVKISYHCIQLALAILGQPPQNNRPVLFRHISPPAWAYFVSYESREARIRGASVLLPEALKRLAQPVGLPSIATRFPSSSVTIAFNCPA